MPSRKILYIAAHGGFDINRVPVGGAAAIATFLSREWSRQSDFSFELITPEILGERAPRDKALVLYTERQYARFCSEFEAAATAYVERFNPPDVIVLCNDISEGPDLRRLRQRGYSLFTIYHVDVVDYVASMYLRGWITPERLTQWHRSIERTPFRKLIPPVLNLVFEKQQNTVLYSQGIVVPSAGMKRTLLRCYPATPPQNIHVLPWGIPDQTIVASEVANADRIWRDRYRISPDMPVLICLSRISPEKGQDRLLKALALWERQPDYPPSGICLLICGEAAYMQGKRFLTRLQRLAKKLSRTRVIFTGYLAAADKSTHFAIADLYVFPSRHESYGLTLLEAFQAGLPALATTHYGSEGLIGQDFGRLIPPVAEAEIPGEMLRALKPLLRDRTALKEMGKKARQYAATQTFSNAAARLAAILQS